MPHDKWIWTPTPEWIEQTNVHRFMQRLNISDREAFLRFSSENPEAFWDEMVRETAIDWFIPYQKVLDTSQGPEWTRWFLGGQLNIAWNCVDRHAKSTTPAILWEGEDGSTRNLTFSEMHQEVNRLANGLKALGLEEGDRTALCMPMTPEVVLILYACLKLGIIVVPIFAGFGAAAIATRLDDSGARAVFTSDYLERRGRKIPLKEKVDQAVEKAAMIQYVVVLRYKGGDVLWQQGRDIWWDDVVRDQSPECNSLPLDSESRALVIYTSGTTGKPKGAVHTHAGCLAQMTKEIYLAFDHKLEDRFFWLSDMGWMMGPWTIIGNHHFGGTVFLYDGAPDHPNADRLWEMVERHGITTLGISPTAIRILMRTSSPDRFPLESLRLLGSTGEPWDDTSYIWFFEKIGKRRLPIINISGGTEIVGSFVFPLPIQPLKACTVGGPAPGMAVEVVDEEGRPVRGKTGYLVCTKPSPSMTRGLWRDAKRYLATYWSRWPGYWFHGDWASVDEDGCWFLHGRADESMNVAGRKVGPAEIEDALMEHPAVSEAAVIGVPDDLKGEGIVAFYVAKSNFAADDTLSEKLSRHLVEQLGPTFRPNAIHPVKELPKTQSGKVVRRLIRRMYLGEPPGDISTVENPGALQGFVQAGL
ncbi:MAG: AMP-binding protein [Bryobacteraceae bacterium]